MLRETLNVLDAVGRSEINSCAYDTAWVARVPHRDNPHRPAFPEALKWVLNHQNEDGSWGEGDPPEKILATLAVLIALKSFPNFRVHTHVKKGQTYVWQCLIDLKVETDKLPIGFELLLQTLMDEAYEKGINLPPFLRIAYQEAQKEKWALLAEIPIPALSQTTASFSIEFLGKQLAEYADCFVQPGQLVSPAAAAALLLYVKNETNKEILEKYLRDTARLDETGMSWPNLTDFDNFERGWVLYNLLLAGYLENPLLAEAVRKSLANLWAEMNLKPEGVAFSSKFPVPDSDTTALCLLVLQKGGYSIDPTILDNYWTGEYMVGGVAERITATSTNVHCMEFFSRTDQPTKAEAIRKFLISMPKKYPFCWEDKWHASPYYVTSHYVIATGGEGLELKEILDWLLNSQRTEGGWGWQLAEEPTLEETAYVVQALCVASKQRNDPAILTAITEGAAWLRENYGGIDQHTSLWRGKNLYKPVLVIKSAVISALTLADGVLNTRIQKKTTLINKS